MKPSRYKKIIRVILVPVFITISTGASHYNSAFQVTEEIAVFYPFDYYEKDTQPSLIFENELKHKKPLNENWRVKPIFETKNGKQAVIIHLNESCDFYGTGEVTGNLIRNNTRIKLWNTDNYCYEKDSGSRLYQSHPWIMAVRPDGSSVGVIADNTWKQSIDIKNHIEIISDGPPFRVIVIEKENPLELVKVLSELTGKIDLPPLWALGFQQCKYSYFPDSRVKEIADKFREYKIPCDVIWMDIDYMDKYKVFTFDDDRFPNPSELNQYLKENKFKSVYMIDPGVKKETGYSVYDTGTTGNHWVKTDDGNDFIGDVWPGACVFPDFTRSETVEWWETLYIDFMNLGIDGVWNDMNEPAVFNGPDGTMPIDNWHRGGYSNLPPGPHLRYHNIYGLLMVKASRSGIMKNNPNKRPFVLSRANFLGGQKYAATWTGDNKSTWDHMKLSIPMSLNLSLSGQPFNGPDIGGFEGNCNKDLLGHWMSLGAFYPFSRNHSSNNSIDQEPWAFGPEITDASRRAMTLRYMLLPYIYTEFFKCSEYGTPIMRPTYFADFKDLLLRDEQESFLFGNDILVIPRWASNLDLPKGDWDQIKIIEQDKYQPIILQRPGSIIPVSEKIQSTVDYDTKNITLLINPDHNNRAFGMLYDDEGDGFSYTNGNYSVDEFTCNPSTDGKLRIEINQVRGHRINERNYRIGLVSDGVINFSEWSSNNTLMIDNNLTESKKINTDLFPSMYWIHKRNISKEKSLQRMNYEGNGVWISEESFFTAGTHDIILSKSKKLNDKLWGNNNSLNGKLELYRDTKKIKPLRVNIVDEGKYDLIFNEYTREYNLAKSSKYNYIGIVGDATAFGWNPIGIPMEKIITNPGQFSWEGKLTKGTLKFHTCSGSWEEGEWIHPLKDNEQLNVSKFNIYADGKGADYKWKIEHDGIYKIIINLNNVSVKIKRLDD